MFYTKLSSIILEYHANKRVPPASIYKMLNRVINQSHHSQLHKIPKLNSHKPRYRLM